ncbi:Hypothetical protein D9617_36g063410 [Elsinoe fawcettii]|nr:Hypothetical protein D9617_36g063410 [Elsinoe fawcettii]
MHFLPILAILSLASANPLIKRQSSTQCSIAAYDTKTKAYFFQKGDSVATPSACGAQCNSDSRCRSFAVGSGACLLYTVLVADNTNKDVKSPYRFFDRACITTTTTTTTTKTTTAPPATTTSAATTPATVTTSRTSMNTTPTTTTTSAVTNSPGAITTTTTAITTTTAASPSSSLCGLKGYDKNAPKAYSATKQSSLIVCANICQGASMCKTFAYGQGTCYLYSTALPLNYRADDTSKFVFYAKSCNVNPATTTTTPITNDDHYLYDYNADNYHYYYDDHYDDVNNYNFDYDFDYDFDHDDDHYDDHDYSYHNYFNDDYGNYYHLGNSCSQRVSILPEWQPSRWSLSVLTNLRIEGAFGTIYEGKILAGPRDITTPSGGTHRCDGTNNNANPAPFNNGISTIDAASKLCSFGYDGTYSTQFQDFFIQTIGDTPSTGSQFWGILNNYAFTAAGGCETEVLPTDELLWAFNAFNVNFFLRVQPTQTPVTLAPGQTTTFTVQGTNGDSGNFQPVAGASFAGLTSGNDGTIIYTAPTTPGTYRYKATRSDSIRSNAVTIVVQG